MASAAAVAENPRSFAVEEGAREHEVHASGEAQGCEPPNPRVGCPAAAKNFLLTASSPRTFRSGSSKLFAKSSDSLTPSSSAKTTSPTGWTARERARIETLGGNREINLWNSQRHGRDNKELEGREAGEEYVGHV